VVEPLDKHARILKSANSLVVKQCRYLSPTHPLTGGLCLPAIPMSARATSRELAAGARIERRMEIWEYGVAPLLPAVARGGDDPRLPASIRRPTTGRTTWHTRTSSAALRATKPSKSEDQQVRRVLYAAAIDAAEAGAGVMATSGAGSPYKI
jgi:hypothetical protein